MDKGSTGLNFHPVSSCAFMPSEEKSSPGLPQTSSRTTSTPDILLQLLIALLLSNPLVASLCKCMAFEDISAWHLRVFTLRSQSCLSEFSLWWPELPQLGILCWGRTKACGNALTTKIRGKNLALTEFHGRLSIIFGWTRFHPGALLAFSITVRDQCAATKFSLGFRHEMGKKCMLVSVEEICQPGIYFRTYKTISLLSPTPCPKILKKISLERSLHFQKIFSHKHEEPLSAHLVWWWLSWHAPRWGVSSVRSIAPDTRPAGQVDFLYSQRREIGTFMERFGSS